MKKQHNIYFTKNFTEIKCLDILLEEVLGITKIGTFLEIGAYDGFTNSKTHHLANIGWQGIYVEPIKEYADKCRQVHTQNNVTIVQAAISDEDKRQTIYKGELSSTFLEENRNKIREAKKNNGKVLSFTEEEVLVLSWNTFKKNYQIQSPDVFVVDAEGCDWKIFKSIDFKEFRPAIIFTEIFTEEYHYMSDLTIADGAKIKNLLLNEGYHIWIIETHNIVFVDTKKLNPITLLAEEFRIENSIFNLFDQLKSSQNEELNELLIARRGDVLLWSLLETSIRENNTLLIENVLEKIKFLSLLLSEKKLIKLNIALIILNNYEAIVEHCNKWLQHNEYEIKIIKAISFALLKLKRINEAIPYYEWLTQQEPNNKIWRNQLLLFKKKLKNDNL